MNCLAWYRRIAPLYDPVCGPLYAGPRRTARRALALRPGERVLDLGCGTGLALLGLAEDVGPAGQVVGVDGSPRMLARARRRCARLPQVDLYEADLRDADPAPGAAGPFDALHVSLVLAVVDDWQRVFARAWERLRPGGRCVVWDTRPLRGGWRALNPLFVPAAGWSGRAELRRPTWSVLDGRAQEVSLRHHLGGFVFVLAGRRPEGEDGPGPEGGAGRRSG